MLTFISDPSMFFRGIIDETTDARIIEVAFEGKVTRTVAIHHLQLIQCNVTLKTSTSNTLKNDLDEGSKNDSLLSMIGEVQINIRCIRR